MMPLRDAPDDRFAGVQYVLTDIDDTLTRDGRVSCVSYCALWRLHESGVRVIPVTGRPAGWCDLIARQWPVEAVVGENGAFVFYLNDGSLRHIYHPSVDRAEGRTRLAAIAERVYRDVPGTRAAKDQFGRLFDLAVDFREEPPYLDFEAARKIQRLFETEGAHAKISSIHVNAWFGDYDKLSMTKIFFRERYGLDLEAPEQNRLVVFVGDSPNDEPMFGFFENSCAVSNVSEFVDSLTERPAYVTSRSHGEGFAEVADRLLRSRETVGVSATGTP
ncbi:MAG TPA: HAD-IIB family hydrolase [Spirochaetia bacterium]|nr:HAD-IIB family hydrolase [Spirochaetia bacterium]